MFISRIFRPSGVSKPKARGRRTQCERLFQLEPLENRTPLSAGLDIGIAAALILKQPQVEVADFSVGPQIDWTTQRTIAVSAPTLAGSGGLFEGNLQSTLPAATGDILPSAPGTVEPVESLAVDGPITAPLFSPPYSATALESGISPTWIGSKVLVENTLDSLGSTPVAGDAQGLGLSSVNLFAVSHESQYSGPAFDPSVVQHNFLVGPVAKFLIEESYAENDEFNPMPPPPPGSGSTSWSSAKTQLPSIDINSINDPDISVLGSLMSPEAHEGSSALMTTESTTGRALGFRVRRDLDRTFDPDGPEPTPAATAGCRMWQREDRSSPAANLRSSRATLSHHWTKWPPRQVHPPRSRPARYP